MALTDGFTPDQLLEQHVHDAASQLVSEYQPALERHGVTADLGRLRRSGRGSAYESEVEVFFFKGVDFADVIFLPIYLEGRLQGSPHDFENWLRAAFDGVLKRLGTEGSST